MLNGTEFYGMKKFNKLPDDVNGYESGSELGRKL